jgi:protein-tyrosine phosphatase
MQMFLDDLRALHGSVEAFAKDIGITDDEVQSMRSHLLTDL